MSMTTCPVCGSEVVCAYCPRCNIATALVGDDVGDTIYNAMIGEGALNLACDDLGMGTNWDQFRAILRDVAETKTRRGKLGNRDAIRASAALVKMR